MRRIGTLFSASPAAIILAIAEIEGRITANYAVNMSFNARRRDMLNRLLDGFTGKLTSSKWAGITQTSQDAALRDIDDLVRRGILVKNAAGGRSTSYSLLPGFSPEPGGPR